MSTLYGVAMFVTQSVPSEKLFLFMYLIKLWDIPKSSNQGILKVYEHLLTLNEPYYANSLRLSGTNGRPSLSSLSSKETTASYYIGVNLFCCRFLYCTQCDWHIW